MLINVTAADNSAVRPVPPHFRNLFSARQVRKLDRISSAAVVIDIAGPSNSSMVYSSNIGSGDGQFQVIDTPANGMGQTRPIRDMQRRRCQCELWVEQYEVISTP